MATEEAVFDNDEHTAPDIHLSSPGHQEVGAFAASLTGTSAGQPVASEHATEDSLAPDTVLPHVTTTELIADRSTAWPELHEALRDYSKLRDKVRQARNQVLALQYDLQHQRDASQHLHRFYHESALAIKQEGSLGPRMVATAGGHLSSAQLEKDYDEMIAQDQVVKLLDEDLGLRLKSLQAVEDAEEDALSSLLIAIGFGNVSVPEERTFMSMSSPDTAALHEHDGSQANSHDTDPLLREYFSRTGDVRYLTERLMDLVTHYTAERERRDVLIDQDQPSEDTDESFERSRDVDIQHAEEDLQAAINAAELSRATCIAADVEIPGTGRHSSVNEEVPASNDLVLGFEYEVPRLSASIRAHTTAWNEHASSTGDTGPMLESDSFLPRSGAGARRPHENVGAWVRELAATSFEEIPLSGTPIASTPIVEEQPIVPSQGCANGPQISALDRTAPEAEDEQDSPTAVPPIESNLQARCRTTPETVEGSESVHSQLLYDFETPIEDSGLEKKSPMATKRARMQAKCRFTRTLRALARKYKTSAHGAAQAHAS